MLELLKQTFKEWTEDHVPVQAAALAYYTIFSIAPLLLVMIALVGLFAGRTVAQDSILTEVGNLIGKDGKSLVAGMLKATSQNQSQGFIGLLLGIVALLAGATGAFVQLQQTLNIIWGATPAKGIATLVRVRIVSFGLILVTGFLLLVSLAISAVVTALIAKADVSVLPQLANLVVSVLIASFLFALIYKYLPDTHIAWRDALFGGFFTSVLFNLGKFLIGLYLGKSAVASAYGAAGSLVVTLLWVYFSAQIILFGAEFTQVRARVGTQSIETQKSLPRASKSSAEPNNLDEPKKRKAISAGLLPFVGLVLVWMIVLKRNNK